jgi:hypothetical protein
MNNINANGKSAYENQKFHKTSRKLVFPVQELSKLTQNLTFFKR